MMNRCHSHLQLFFSAVRILLPCSSLVQASRPISKSSCVLGLSRSAMTPFRSRESSLEEGALHEMKHSLPEQKNLDFLLQHWSSKRGRPENNIRMHNIPKGGELNYLE